jgi:lipid II:glycine glycyltransferase (peptidoglycan interpeptide bridge formation enzyme)
MSFGLTTDETAWDEFNLARGGGFLQSWGWSQFQEALGRGVYRVRLSGGAAGEMNETTLQMLVVRHGLPLGLSYLYVPRGPVLGGEGDDRAMRERANAALTAIAEAARRAKATFARVDWPMERGAQWLTAHDLKAMGLVAAGHMQPADTVIVDLTQDEEGLLAAMKPKTRYNIRVAERHGVTVTEAEYGNAHLLRRDLEVLWGLLAETADRDRFSLHERGYYERMIDVLGPRSTESGALHVRLAFAMHEGQAIAAGLFAEYGDTVTYLHGASLSDKRAVMAPFKLHWEVIRQAKARGFRHYDFWGVAPEDADEDHPWHGITRFKTGFGGERVSYLGAWDLPQSRMLYAAYRAYRRFRGR